MTLILKVIFVVTSHKTRHAGPLQRQSFLLGAVSVTLRVCGPSSNDHSLLSRSGVPAVTSPLDSTLLLRASVSCAMPTADESNHSAAGTTYPHRSASAT